MEGHTLQASKPKHKMSLEQATEEVQNWLDYKGFEIEAEDDEMKEVIALAKKVRSGDLVINEDRTITHKLRFPIGKDEEIKEVTYQARIKAKDFEAKAKGAKTSSPLSFVHAKIAAIATLNTEIVRNMDTVDYNVAQSIAGFF
jgi:hypothetical protein